MSTATQLITVAEFKKLSWPENGQKMELLDGQVVIVPPAKRTHSRIAGRIFLFIADRFDRDRVYIDGSGYEVDDRRWYVPDVSVVWPDQKISEEDYLLAAPMVAVEVLSPHKDTVGKTTGYFERGAQEVWEVDSRSRRMTAFVRRGKDVIRIAVDNDYHSEALGL